jgi:ketosteroid isomerase-like protein
MIAQIDRTHRAFCDALAAGDATAIAAVYTADARLLAPGSDLLEGAGAIADFWRAGIAAGIRCAELQTLSVDEHDGLAIEVGRYKLAIEPAGCDRVIDSGKYVVIHRQVDGGWQWDLDIFNSDRPDRLMPASPAAPTSEPVPERTRANKRAPERTNAYETRSQQ